MRLAVRRVTSGLVCIASGGQFMSGNVHSTIGPQRNKLGEIEMAAKEIVPKTDLARQRKHDTVAVKYNGILATLTRPRVLPYLTNSSID